MPRLGDSIIRRGGYSVPGFGLGSDARAERLRVALREVIGFIEQFARTLTAREETILRLGLEASHMEESVAHGDWARAESHAEAIVGLYRRLGLPG